VRTPREAIELERVKTKATLDRARVDLALRQLELVANAAYIACMARGRACHAPSARWTYVRTLDRRATSPWDLCPVTCDL
jgi:hypothetical protein